MCGSIVLLLLGVCLVIAQEEASQISVEPRNLSSSTRIVGGEPVTDRSKYAYQVSLRYYNRFLCGGSIVSTKHVLTAAHCCFSNNILIDAFALSAVVGDLYLTASSDTVSKSISSITVHENYDPDYNFDDVALMMLTDAFTKWTTTINLIPLATSSPESGTDCVVSGWGSMQELGLVSEVLQTVTVPIVDRDTCMIGYKDAIQDGMICAGFDEGGKDACQGDSGGPMVCNSVLVGIVSWGYGCARENYPGVYADVAYYHSWIEAKISADGNVDENDDQDNGVAEVSPLKFLLAIVGLSWCIFHRYMFR